MNQQKIAIALPLEDKLLAPLYRWGKRFDWTHISAVHFLHVVKKSVSALEFGLVEVPDEKTYQSMVPNLQQHLRSEAEKIVPKSFKGEVFYHLDLNFGPEDKIIATLKDIHATLLVVSTRGKHGFEGLFYSSFADKMVKYSPCDVYIVRPEAPIEK